MITAMPRIAIASPDFDALVRRCRDGLGLPVNDLSDTWLPVLGARLAMAVPPGGSHIELMSPAVADAPLSQSLQRFLDRRGPGLFALMLEAPDPDAEAATLAARGLDVLPLMPGAGGRDIHPRSAHGVLIRIYPVDSYTGTRPPGWLPDPMTGPLSGVMRVQIAVADLAAAANTWGALLGLRAGAPVVDAAHGVARVCVHPPRGGTIELLAVHDASRPFAAALAARLAERGEGLHALVLQAPQPAALLPVLAARGLAARPAADAPGAIEILPEAMAGALLRIEPAPA